MGAGRLREVMWSADVDRVPWVHPVNWPGRWAGGPPAPEGMLLWRVGRSHEKGVGGALQPWLSFGRARVGV